MSNLTKDEVKHITTPESLNKFFANPEKLSLGAIQLLTARAKRVARELSQDTLKRIISEAKNQIDLWKEQNKDSLAFQNFCKNAEFLEKCIVP